MGGHQARFLLEPLLQRQKTTSWLNHCLQRLCQPDLFRSVTKTWKTRKQGSAPVKTPCPTHLANAIALRRYHPHQRRAKTRFQEPIMPDIPSAHRPRHSTPTPHAWRRRLLGKVSVFLAAAWVAAFDEPPAFSTLTSKTCNHRLDKATVNPALNATFLRPQRSKSA